MSSDILQNIRDMQHTDKSGAEALLLSFICDNFPLDVVSLYLTPLAVSLNSFNGFLTLSDGTRRFFKTHTETDTVIDEYYNAGMLAEAGYPIIQPVFQSTEPGKQLLLYDVIEDESVFDVAWRIENNNSSSEELAHLSAVQQRSDDELYRLYQETMAIQSAQDAGKSPIHQLFYHRLTGGRLGRFYGDDVPIQLPDGLYKMSDVRCKKWLINGQLYEDTLDAIIQQAIKILQPDQEDISIIGHGDAHNGNVFFSTTAQPASMLYFDPAFAGRHHPLLDLTKPLFHNIFAMWMYFPQEIQANTSISFRTSDDTWVVEYEYELPAVRKMFLSSKVERTLIPTLQYLHTEGLLRKDWRQYLKSALFCCPLLTMNLADHQKFPPEIALLGLAMAVEMGAESHTKRSLIDQTLDVAESTLS